MTRRVFWILPLVAAFWIGCGDEEPDLQICPGGSCELPSDCQEACESVCQSRDFGRFDCVVDEDGLSQCECECFFGCP